MGGMEVRILDSEEWDAMDEWDELDMRFQAADFGEKVRILEEICGAPPVDDDMLLEWFLDLNDAAESEQDRFAFGKCVDLLMESLPDTYAELGADYEIYAYLESTLNPDPGNPDLAGRVRSFLGSEEMRLEASVGEVIGLEDGSWERKDYEITRNTFRKPEDERSHFYQGLHTLASTFLGWLHQEKEMSYTRASLVRTDLLLFLVERLDGDLKNFGFLNQAPYKNNLSRRIETAGSESMPKYEQWLAMLMAPGTSLGGARPKANFRDEDGRLWLAKFPAQEGRHDVGAWEFLVHQMARRAGIKVPDARLEELSARHRTYCANRFDRIGNSRRMFASAMTLLERRDGDKESGYLGLAQFVSENGAADHIVEDLEQLFRRVVFNVLVGNRDDHLRNHAFIREPSGWRLSPAYDVNPVPAKTEHALRLDESTASPNLDAVFATSEYYRIGSSRAKKIMDEVKGEVATWRTEANRLGLARSEIELVGRAFGIN